MELHHQQLYSLGIGESAPCNFPHFIFFCACIPYLKQSTKVKKSYLDIAKAFAAFEKTILAEEQVTQTDPEELLFVVLKLTTETPCS